MFGKFSKSFRWQHSAAVFYVENVFVKFSRNRRWEHEINFNILDFFQKFSRVRTRKSENIRVRVRPKVRDSTESESGSESGSLPLVEKFIKKDQLNLSFFKKSYVEKCKAKPNLIFSQKKIAFILDLNLGTAFRKSTHPAEELPFQLE